MYTHIHACTSIYIYSHNTPYILVNLVISFTLKSVRNNSKCDCQNFLSDLCEAAIGNFLLSKLPRSFLKEKKNGMKCIYTHDIKFAF